MRTLCILVISVITFFIKGDIQVCATHLYKDPSTLTYLKSKESQVSPAAFKNGLKAEHIDLTAYYADFEEIICSAQVMAMVKNFALISYVMTLLLLIHLIKSRINFHWNQTFPSSEKYILQRVLRL